MMLETYTLQTEKPSVEEFNHLRRILGWAVLDAEMVEFGQKNSLFQASIRKDEKLVATARLVGDGAMYFYIQDFMVDPAHQKMGLGDALMGSLNDYLLLAAKPGATIGLLAAKGKEPFYLKHGFIDRTGQSWGRGMCKFV